MIESQGSSAAIAKASRWSRVAEQIRSIAVPAFLLAAITLCSQLHDLATGSVAHALQLSSLARYSEGRAQSGVMLEIDRAKQNSRCRTSRLSRVHAIAVSVTILASIAFLIAQFPSRQRKAGARIPAGPGLPGT